jgi:hypothetical protein
MKINNNVLNINNILFEGWVNFGGMGEFWGRFYKLLYRIYPYRKSL